MALPYITGRQAQIITDDILSDFEGGSGSGFEKITDYNVIDSLCVAENEGKIYQYDAQSIITSTKDISEGLSVSLDSELFATKVNNELGHYKFNYSEGNWSLGEKFDFTLDKLTGDTYQQYVMHVNQNLHMLEGDVTVRIKFKDSAQETYGLPETFDYNDEMVYGVLSSETGIETLFLQGPSAQPEIHVTDDITYIMFFFDSYVVDSSTQTTTYKESTATIMLCSDSTVTSTYLDDTIEYFEVIQEGEIKFTTKEASIVNLSEYGITVSRENDGDKFTTTLETAPYVKYDLYQMKSKYGFEGGVNPELDASYTTLYKSTNNTYDNFKVIFDSINDEYTYQKTIFETVVDNNVPDNYSISFKFIDSSSYLDSKVLIKRFENANLTYGDSVEGIIKEYEGEKYFVVKDYTAFNASTIGFSISELLNIGIIITKDGTTITDDSDLSDIYNQKIRITYNNYEKKDTDITVEFLNKKVTNVITAFKLNTDELSYYGIKKDCYGFYEAVYLPNVTSWLWMNDDMRNLLIEERFEIPELINGFLDSNNIELNEGRVSVVDTNLCKFVSANPYAKVYYLNELLTKELPEGGNEGDVLTLEGDKPVWKEFSLPANYIEVESSQSIKNGNLYIIDDNASKGNTLTAKDSTINLADADLWEGNPGLVMVYTYDNGSGGSSWMAYQTIIKPLYWSKYKSYNTGADPDKHYIYEMTALVYSNTNSSRPIICKLKTGSDYTTLYFDLLDSYKSKNVFSLVSSEISSSNTLVVTTSAGSYGLGKLPYTTTVGYNVSSITATIGGNSVTFNFTNSIAASFIENSSYRSGEIILSGNGSAKDPTSASSISEQTLTRIDFNVHLISDGTPAMYSPSYRNIKLQVDSTASYITRPVFDTTSKALTGFENCKITSVTFTRYYR